MEMNAHYFYTESYRLLMLNKLNIRTNNFAIPKIAKLLYFFTLTKIDDIDNVEIYNHIYLFKYFFGKLAYLTKIKSFFNLGK